MLIMCSRKYSARSNVQYGNHGLQKIQKTTTKKNTTHNIQQHGTESLQLCMHRMKIIFNIFGRTKNVAKLKPNIKINELSISCFDTKE